MYTLLVTKGPDLGLSYEIRTGRVAVGTAGDMNFVLTDRSVRPRHFMVVFEEGSWKAITYEPDTTILIDRRWQHPRTGQRGARIFVGESQLLLFAGEIDLATAESGAEGLDMDAETLRDDALTQVGDQAFRFRHDMLGEAQPVNDRKNDPRRPKVVRSDAGARTGEPSAPSRSAQRTPQGAPRRDEPIAPSQSRTRGAPAGPGPGNGMPEGILPAEGSKLFSANAGMMRLPETVEKGRRGAPPPDAEPPKSARSTWSPPRSDRGPVGSALAVQEPGRALTKGQMISLTDTALSAMPSSSRDLVVLYDRDGEFASMIRILATRIEELKTRLGYKSFLVTSVGDSDGKTVLSNNLALAMSEDFERKVALVDANFRSPRAGELFNLDASRGLLAALSGERPLAQCVARVLGRNLIVLHAGGEHKNPASVLASAKFKALLAELYQAVDFMIVDAPSAVPHADVPLLAQHVDAVLMVVARGRTRRADLDRALDTIGRSRVAGTVFVDRPKKGRAKA